MEDVPKVKEPKAGDVRNERIDYTAAARYLGIKLATLRDMVHKGKVPHVRLGPRHVVFDVDALDRWMRERSR